MASIPSEGFTIDPAYAARAASLPEQRITLSSGRHISYFAEGDPNDVPVIALAGPAAGKACWIQKERILGIYLVAIDRPGYGGSSPPTNWETYSLSREAVEDVREIALALNLPVFMVLGWSCGGAWAARVAAGLPDMVSGLGIFCLRSIGSMRSTWHIAGEASPSKLIERVRESDGALRLAWEDMTRNAFQVSKLVDSLSAHRSSEALAMDCRLERESPPIDADSIKCPVHVWHGPLDDVAPSLLRHGTNDDGAGAIPTAAARRELQLPSRSVLYGFNEEGSHTLLFNDSVPAQILCLVSDVYSYMMSMPGFVADADAHELEFEGLDDFDD